MTKFKKTTSILNINMNTNTNNNSNTTKNSDWSKREIGALWKKDGATQKVLSGYVKIDELGLEKEVKVVVFANKNKSKDTAPDYRIFVSKPKNEAIESVAKPVQSQAKTVKQTPAKKIVQEVVEDEDDSIL